MPLITLTKGAFAFYTSPIPKAVVSEKEYSSLQNIPDELLILRTHGGDDFPVPAEFGLEIASIRITKANLRRLPMHLFWGGRRTMWNTLGSQE